MEKSLHSSENDFFFELAASKTIQQFQIQERRFLMIIVYSLAVWFVFVGIFVLGSYSQKCAAKQRTLEEEASKWRRVRSKYTEFNLEKRMDLRKVDMDLYFLIEDKNFKAEDVK
jgi:hypothetical protein